MLLLFCILTVGISDDAFKCGFGCEISILVMYHWHFLVVPQCVSIVSAGNSSASCTYPDFSAISSRSCCDPPAESIASCCLCS